MTDNKEQIMRDIPRMSLEDAKVSALELLEDWQPTKVQGKASKNRTIYDIQKARTSNEICGIIYRVQMAKEGLGTVGSGWQQHYRNI